MPKRDLPGIRVPPSLVIWLVIVWMLLWGTFDVATAVYGLIVALAVLVLFPLPSHPWNIFRRPHRLVVLVVYVGIDLFSSALRFVAESVRASGKVSAAIIAVPVLSDVDHVIASAANVVSLAPGTFVLQIDRTNGIWYVYTSGVRTPEAAHNAYDDVIDMQRIVVWAFGDHEEAAAVRRWAEEAKQRRDRSVVQHPPRVGSTERDAHESADAGASEVAASEFGASDVGASDAGSTESTPSGSRAAGPADETREER